MSDLWYGGEVGSVTPSSGDVYEVATIGGFDPLRARCAVRIGTSASYAESAILAGQSEVWFHWRPYFGDSILSTTVTVFSLMSGSAEQVRLRWSESGGTGTLTTQANISGVWTDIGATFGLPIVTLHTLDIHLKISTDVLEVYSSGSLLTDNTVTAVDLASLSAITSARWYGGALTFVSISELAASTVSTIGMSIGVRYPNGAGNDSAWTGAYTDIDEVTFSDVDAISSASANDVSNFTHTGPSIAGLVIRGVGVDLRASKGASGPTGVQGHLRIGSTNYFGSTLTLGSGRGAHCTVWETSPATSSAFDATEVESLQIGAKSIA